MRAFFICNLMFSVSKIGIEKTLSHHRVWLFFLCVWMLLCEFLGVGWLC